MVCGCGTEEEYDEKDGVKVALKQYEDRRTTDVLFLIGIIVMWVVMTIVGAISFAEGNPNRLIGPISSEGLICGLDPAVVNQENLYYVTRYGMGQCVDDCPTVDENTASVLYDDYICLPWVDTFYASSLSPAADFSNYVTSSCMTNSVYDATLGCSCNIKRASKPVFDRCVYTTPGTSTPNENPTSSDYLKMFAADIITARNVVFGFGFCIALVSSFLFSYLMSINWIAWAMTWSCILSVLICGIAVVSYGRSLQVSWEEEDPQEHTESQINLLITFNYFMMALALAYFVVMVFFRNAINMAIKCVSMASKAVDEMPLMVFMPILQIAGLLLFMVPFVYYALYIASDGYYTFTTQSVSFGGTSTDVVIGREWHADHDDHVGMKLWYLFFCLLWTMNFISNFGSLVISHAVATWYFTKPEDRVEAISSYTVLTSYKLVSRFHLGTVAFGSLCIALIQFARAIAMYLERNLSEEFRSQTWVKIVFCCINCCLCCLECIMKFISKNAYIQTAIRGTPFCESAGASFRLIANNMMRIGAILVTSDLALFVGKVFVTVLASSLSYIYISDYFTKDLYDPVGPTVMVAILSWMTATMFMEVLHMSIDTIFHCFIADETSNGGVPAFAGDDVKAFVDTHGKMEEKVTLNPAAE